MTDSCRGYIVSGRVQGVFFRDSTRRKATELGLVGWVRNVSNGNVEVLACGNEEKLNALEKWLWQGPPAADVTEVLSEEHVFETHTDFVII